MYDILEASSVKKETVRLILEIDGESVHRGVRVTDLFSRNKIEFMKAVCSYKEGIAPSTRFHSNHTSI